MDLHTQVNILSLCSGIGGLDLGVHAALRGMGYSPRTLCYVEIEAFACAILAHQMEQTALDAAPIWTDLRTLPSNLFGDSIDMVIGGYPCQPFSVAGKRKGAEDPRHLWPHIRTIIEATRPAICFFENVRGHLKLGFENVRGDLQGLGFAVEPGIFSAAEIGATHRRERLFILAHRDNDGQHRIGGSGLLDGERTPCGDHADGCDEAMADTDGGRLRGEGCPDVEASWLDRAELPLFPPGPGDRAGWERVLAVRPDLAPAVANTSHGKARQTGITSRFGYASTEEAQPPLRGVAPEFPGGLDRNRVDRLRALGNAVVPAVAEHALRCLWREAKG